MSYKTLPSGLYGTNCYILHKDSTALVIDAPPDSFGAVQAFCQQQGLTLKGLFITHFHWDHILDAHLFQEQGIPVLAHDAELKLLQDFSYQAHIVPPGIEGKGVSPDRILKKGPLDWEGFKLQILHTPGHSRDSICLYHKEEELCFCGDLIFREGVGRWDLPGGDGLRLSKSIEDSIFSLPDATRLLPGHGEETTVAHEKACNPYFT